MPSKADPETVVVIGSGISGLAAAWLLTQQGKRVTLLEAEDRLGGHALTVDTDVAGPIDLGFQVCNLTNYPHLFGFFDALGIETVESDMSFALSTPGGRLPEAAVPPFCPAPAPPQHAVNSADACPLPPCRDPQRWSGAPARSRPSSPLRARRGRRDS